MTLEPSAHAGVISPPQNPELCRISVPRKATLLSPAVLSLSFTGSALPITMCVLRTQLCFLSYFLFATTFPEAKVGFFVRLKVFYPFHLPALVHFCPLKEGNTPVAHFDLRDDDDDDDLIFSGNTII